MAKTAKDHNEETSKKRHERADKSANVVNLKPQVSEQERLVKITEITAQFQALKAEGKAINERRKACLEDVEALGLDRNEFRSLTKLLEVDDDKRETKAATRRLFLKAHGIPEQMDMFGTTENVTLEVEVVDEDEALLFERAGIDVYEEPTAA